MHEQRPDPSSPPVTRRRVGIVLAVAAVVLASMYAASTLSFEHSITSPVPGAYARPGAASHLLRRRKRAAAEAPSECCNRHSQVGPMQPSRHRLGG